MIPGQDFKKKPVHVTELDKPENKMAAATSVDLGLARVHGYEPAKSKKVTGPNQELTEGVKSAINLTDARVLWSTACQSQTSSIVSLIVKSLEGSRSHNAAVSIRTATKRNKRRKPAIARRAARAAEPRAADENPPEERKGERTIRKGAKPAGARATDIKVAEQKAERKSADKHRTTRAAASEHSIEVESVDSTLAQKGKWSTAARGAESIKLRSYNKKEQRTREEAKARRSEYVAKQKGKTLEELTQENAPSLVASAPVIVEDKLSAENNTNKSTVSATVLVTNRSHPVNKASTSSIEKAAQTPEMKPSPVDIQDLFARGHWFKELVGSNRINTQTDKTEAGPSAVILPNLRTQKRAKFGFRRLVKRTKGRGGSRTVTEGTRTTAAPRASEDKTAEQRIEVGRIPLPPDAEASGTTQAKAALTSLVLETASAVATTSQRRLTKDPLIKTPSTAAPLCTSVVTRAVNPTESRPTPASFALTPTTAIPSSAPTRSVTTKTTTAATTSSYASTSATAATALAVSALASAAVTASATPVPPTLATAVTVLATALAIPPARPMG